MSKTLSTSHLHNANRIATLILLTSLCRNPVFFPSDRNTFFFFGVSQTLGSLTSSPSVTISFWDYDSVGAREEIGQVNMSFDRLLLSGERCPSDIISLPIVIHKPKTSPIRGYVDLRYGLVSVAPPLPAAELLSRAPVHPHPFSHYLQRRIRFLQVTVLPRRTARHPHVPFVLPVNAPSQPSFSQKYDPASLISVHADAWTAFVGDSHEASMQSLVTLWGPEP